jgi:hypothetical protein
MSRIFAVDRRRGHGAMQILILAASAVVLCVGGAESRAWAQQSGASVLESFRPQVEPWPAPVGHRQPQRKDLPPSMRKDEGAITSGQHNFDDSLNICRC